MHTRPRLLIALLRAPSYHWIEGARTGYQYWWAGYKHCPAARERQPPYPYLVTYDQPDAAPPKDLSVEAEGLVGDDQDGGRHPQAALVHESGYREKGIQGRGNHRQKSPGRR